MFDYRVVGAGMGVAFFAAAAAAEPVFFGNAFSGSTNWEVDGVPGGPGTSGASWTPNSSHGQTGGGVLDICNALSESDGAITDAFAPGETLLTYDWHFEATFDSANHTGFIECIVVTGFIFRLDAFHTFTLTPSGDIAGSFNLSPLPGPDAGVIDGNTLSPGIYRLDHNFLVGVGDGYAQDSAVRDGHVELLLGPSVIPLPSAAAMAFVGLVGVALRRRR